MLLSIVLGNQNEIKNDWELVEDRYGNSIIGNSYLKQKIRLGKNVEKKLDKVYSSSNAVAYDIADNTFISNNQSNMNLALIKYWNKDQELIDQFTHDNILYITFSNKSYKLISYDNLGNEIVQTYKKIGEYQGCAFTFKYFGCNLFRLYAKDLVMNKFVEIVISIDENGKVSVVKNVIEDRDILNKVRNEAKALNRRFVHFKVSTESGKLLTNTYITTKEHEELVDEITDDITNVNIIVVENVDGKLVTEFGDDISELLRPNSRAITTVGVDLPKDFCKNYKILYLFDYDVETAKLTCIRSN